MFNYFGFEIQSFFNQPTLSIGILCFQWTNVFGSQTLDSKKTDIGFLDLSTLQSF